MTALIDRQGLLLTDLVSVAIENAMELPEIAEEPSNKVGLSSTMRHHKRSQRPVRFLQQRVSRLKLMS